ncbi:MAG: outer membrane lipoprotein carrier protein LolA [Xanthomonadales bacterium]|nr:hypothetical protein [Xanthomonadales bacterium]MCC6591831.1 outer membrane lipoprotein carrier protein LolA [Xanthomonadales bacterium]
MDSSRPDRLLPGGLWVFRGLLLAACCFLQTAEAAQAPAVAGTQQATSGDPLLTTLSRRLTTTPVLRGEFIQERTLAGFAKPLRSAGRFVAARGRGVLWITREPFPGELAITTEAIRERVDGTEAVMVDASREPALREVNRILLALLQGEFAALAGQFEVSGNATATPWTLQLLPRGPLAQAIAKIELEGGRQVDRVTIHEPGGDVSRIAFSAQTAGARLKPAEAQRFE